MDKIFTIFGVALVFAVVFGFAAYTRYLQYKENMALVEKGILPEQDPKDKSNAILRWSTIFSIVGLFITLVMVPFAWNYYWYLFLLGLLPLAFGLGMMLIYVYTQENPDPGIKEANPEAKPKPTSEVSKNTSTKKKSEE